MSKATKAARKCNPYPLDIFTEPTAAEWQKVQKIFSEAGLVQDKFFGAMARRAWNNAIDAVEDEEAVKHG